MKNRQLQKYAVRIKICKIKLCISNLLTIIQMCSLSRLLFGWFRKKKKDIQMHIINPCPIINIVLHSSFIVLL